jgi:hypothetical protein
MFKRRLVIVLSALSVLSLFAGRAHADIWEWGEGPCVGIHSGMTSNQLLALSQTCTNEPDQRWLLTQDGLIINTYNGLCVGHAGGNLAYNVLATAVCTGGPDQRWFHTPYNEIRSSANGTQCIAPANNGALVNYLVTAPCDNQPDQRWIIRVQ